MCFDIPLPGEVIMNGIEFPERARVDRIISAFANGIDPEKVYVYKKMLDYGSEPPGILGFPSFVTVDDVGEYFMTGEQITPEHIGEIAFKVTDGHHRVLAAVEADRECLLAEPDRSAFTNQAELEALPY